MITTKAYAAIRRNETGEWIDTTTISSLRIVTKDKAAKTDEAVIPPWVKANPVVRFATVEIKEIE